jgi:hypothetical protein
VLKARTRLPRVAALAAIAIASAAALSPDAHGTYARGAEGAAPRTIAVPAGDLGYQGGPVLHSSAPYLVFWTPNGERIPVSARHLLARYLADVAADSGRSNSVYGVLRQYYDRAGFADYRQTFNAARQVIVDRQPYPPRDAATCPDVAAAYPTCISDGQVQAELHRLIAAKHLRTAGSLAEERLTGELSANAPIYFVVLPAHVDACQVGATVCSDKNMCSYHLFSNDAGRAVLYAVIPMHAYLSYRGFRWPKNCQTDSHRIVQEPNGNIADAVISNLSHEDSEVITDPIFSGWVLYGRSQFESVLNEVGDHCASFGSFDPQNGFSPRAFAPTLGGNGAKGTLYDQLINGDRYYIQSEWSNGNRDCEMRPSGGRIAARFSMSNRPKPVGVPIRFNPTASRSRAPISSASWHFGDGSAPLFLVTSAALTPVTHRYKRAGRYTVTLTLVDNRGNLETTTRRVTIKA